MHLLCIYDMKVYYYVGNWVGKVVGDMVTRRDSQENDMRLYLYSAVRITMFLA